MQIIELTKEEFDKFAIKHRNHNFYQTSQYGSLMNRHGFFDAYIALLDDDHQILGASLILVKKLFGRFKYGYAPRGFLINFNDMPLLNIFTKLIKQYLRRRGFVYLKIDPYVINIERDKNGNPIPGGINNQNMINNLKKLGYEHQGFNLYFENFKPRWNAITKIGSTAQRLFTLFDKSIRNKINGAERRGIVVYKGSKDDLKLFYSLIDKKHTRGLNYYLDYYEIFSKNDMFDIYFAKLDIATYLKNSKELYEKESLKNDKLMDDVQNNANNTHLINRKMESDRLLTIYKNDVVKASNLFKSNPEGIILATSAVIKYDKELFFLIDGINIKYKDFSANHLLKWRIIEEYAQKGYLYIHQNGITGDFSKTNKFFGLNQFKLGFNAEVAEYIGEFDLIISNSLYYIYKHIAPIRSLINRAFKK